ncbi:MAG: hypothetical protein K0Q72_3569 [Armatimonadetes bacterium]|jgi:hypothetical protein|nr:hypothetical protein [Armatimonadota bacterium]
MIDLRYLGITLIAVFLSLAIGMMTGSALGGPDKRDAAYEGLRNQFDLLRTENQRVQDENDLVRRRLNAREQALRELQSLAIRNRLAGSTVGVVICGPPSERAYWSELEAALRAAGAQIGPVVRIPDALREIPAEARGRFELAWEDAGTSGLDSAYQPARWVVRALARGGTAQRLEELASLTGIELRGDYRTPVRRLLVLASVPDTNRAAQVTAGDVPEVPTVDAARSEGLRVVAAEPEEAVVSAVDSLRQRLNVPTVDNIDTAAGRISVVLALAGENGQFGSKPGAARPVPPLGDQ